MLPRLRSFGWMVFLAAAGTMVIGQARSQTLDDGWERLYGRYSPVKGRVMGLLKGVEKVDPNDKSQVDAIDLLAKTYTYGIYLQKLDSPAHPGAIRKDYEGFEKDINGILTARSGDQLQPLAEVLRKFVRIHAVEVIQKKEALPIHKLHNARVLAKIAELGEPALAGTFVAILNDKDAQQNDGILYCALKGLATLLPLVQPAEGKPLLPQDQLAKCAEAIITFVEQKKGPGKNAPSEEIEGFRVLRREAIRALAKFRTPAFDDKVRPALVLARFAGNDERIQPSPRIDERVEASLGLARMEPGKDKRYQADYAMGQIGKCLGDFTHAADKERNMKEGRAHPWRVDAKKLSDALEAMRRINEKNQYVTSMVRRGNQLLANVVKGSAIDANELTFWRTPQSDAPSKELFQGSPDSTVKPAPPSEEGTEK